MTRSMLQRSSKILCHGWCAQCKVPIYHVNSIRFGFSAIGKKKWPKMMVDSGQMAVKKLMRQKGGAMVARQIMPALQTMQKRKVNLNFFSSLGTSSKKVVFSISLAVAPQVMLMENMWERRAWLTCNEMPPRKTVRSKIHLKFSQTGRYV